METNIPSPQPDKEKFQLTPEEKVLFSKLAIMLSRALIQSQIYGVDHFYTKDATQQAYAALKKILVDKDNVLLCVIDGKLKYELIPLEEGNLLVQKLIDLFSVIHLVSLRFCKDVSEENFKQFLNIFHTRPENILDGGGIEKLVQDENIVTIEVNPIKYELVGKDQQVVGDDVDILTMDELLKEDVSPSVLLDRIKVAPNKAANAFIRALQAIGKVNTEKREPFISSILEKLTYIKKELTAALSEDIAYTLSKEVNKFSIHFGAQLKFLDISEECRTFFEEVKSLNIEIADRIKAEIVLRGVQKDNFDLKTKSKIAKSAIQRKKVSPNYESILKNILVKRGFPEAQFIQALTEGINYFKDKKKKSASRIQNKIIAFIDEIAGKSDEPDKTRDELVKAVEAEIKTEMEKVREEKKFLEVKFEKVEKILDSLDYGVLILQDGKKVLFVSESVSKIIPVKVGDQLQDSCLKILKTWPQQPEGAIQDSDGNQKIFSCIRFVHKDKQDIVSSAIFTPLSQ